MIPIDADIPGQSVIVDILSPISDSEYTQSNQ